MTAAELELLAAGFPPETDCETCIKALARRVVAAEKIVRAYEELLATVNGECPSILDECRGGSSVLSDLVYDADRALAAWEAAQ